MRYKIDDKVYISREVLIDASNIGGKYGRIKFTKNNFTYNGLFKIIDFVKPFYYKISLLDVKYVPITYWVTEKDLKK